MNKRVVRDSIRLLGALLFFWLFSEDGKTEVERIHLDPSTGNFGCVVPADTWHTVEVFEPSVIYEAKDGTVSLEIKA